MGERIGAAVGLFLVGTLATIGLAAWAGFAAGVAVVIFRAVTG